MNPRSPGAFMLSATFHGLIIGAIFFFAMMADQRDKTPPKVLELVAGEGDNYGATAAPALGTPDGVKLQIPKLAKLKPLPLPTPEPAVEPEPEPTPPPQIPVPEPVKPAPVKPEPKPTPAPAKKAPEQTTPNFRRQILHKVWAADARAKKEVAKERAAEAKRLKAEEAARKARATAAARVQHIDAEGIAKGVLGGSTENKVGGAGGKALTRQDGDLLDAYFAMLKQRVLNALVKPPGISDQLVATVVFTIHADGRITGVRIKNSSGSDEWDRAVVEAFSHVQMPEYPEHKSDEFELDMKTKDVD